MEFKLEFIIIILYYIYEPMTITNYCHVCFKSLVLTQSRYKLEQEKCSPSQQLYYSFKFSKITTTLLLQYFLTSAAYIDILIRTVCIVIIHNIETRISCICIYIQINTNLIPTSFIQLKDCKMCDKCKIPFCCSYDHMCMVNNGYSCTFIVTGLLAQIGNSLSDSCIHYL